MSFVCLCVCFLTQAGLMSGSSHVCEAGCVRTGICPGALCPSWQLTAAVLYLQSKSYSNKGKSTEVISEHVNHKFINPQFTCVFINMQL